MILNVATGVIAANILTFAFFWNLRSIIRTGARLGNLLPLLFVFTAVFLIALAAHQSLAMPQ